MLRSKSAGRLASRNKEEEEDEQLLKDEEDEAYLRSGHRLQVQPASITHGKMREYQLQGLNWLIHLYDNGINGILADEMVREGRRSGTGREEERHWKEELTNVAWMLPVTEQHAVVVILVILCFHWFIL